MAKKRVFLVIACATLSACSNKESATEPEEPPATVVTASFVNRLDLAVSLSAGGTVYGTLNSGASTVLTLPPRTSSVTWTSTKRKFGDGSPMTDELTSASVSLSTNLNTIDITNVVSGVTYFTPYIFKTFADTVAFEVARGTSTICLGWVTGTTFLVGWKWGYYSLTPDTQLRYYRGTSCRAGAAAYRFWSAQVITDRLTVGSGLVSLTADVLP